MRKEQEPNHSYAPVDFAEINRVHRNDIIVGNYENGGVVKFRADKVVEAWSIPGLRSTTDIDKAKQVAEAIYNNRVLAAKIGFKKVTV